MLLQYKDGADGMLGTWRAIYEYNEKATQVWITPFTPAVICYHPDTVRMIFSTAGKESCLTGSGILYNGIRLSVVINPAK